MKKILIVEDNVDLSNNIKFMLSKAGLCCFCCQ